MDDKSEKRNLILADSDQIFAIVSAAYQSWVNRIVIFVAKRDFCQIHVHIGTLVCIDRPSLDGFEGRSLANWVFS